MLKRPYINNILPTLTMTHVSYSNNGQELEAFFGYVVVDSIAA